MADEKIEQEIQDKGLTAPRITPADVEANIKTAVYFTGADAACASAAIAALSGDTSFIPNLSDDDFGCLELLTFCVLVLRNGFTVTGESACASPENFDAEVGRKVARANAIGKVWPLMGYELRSKLAGGAA